MNKILSLFAGLAFATAAVAQNAPQANALFNTWYEWPHESVNGATVYHTAKYVPVPGIDRQDEAFRMISISADGNFIMGEYCGYCPAVKLKEQKNTYKLISNENVVSEIQLNPGRKDSKATYIKVITLEKDKLVIQ